MSIEFCFLILVEKILEWQEDEAPTVRALLGAIGDDEEMKKKV